MTSVEKVKNIIKNEFENFTYGFIAVGSNPFLTASELTQEAQSVDIRSRDSRLGNVIERVAKSLIVSKFGVDMKVISHQFANESLSAEADCLLSYASANSKIGTTQWSTQFNAARKRLKTSKVWSDLGVDFVTDRPGELKMGGNLDSSNARGKTHELIKKSLAFGKEPIFALAYGDANSKPRGGLSKYWAFPSKHFLVGEQFWNYILPDDISGKEFYSLVRSVRESMSPALDFSVGDK